MLGLSGSLVRRCLALVWSWFSVIYLLVISALIVQDAAFPLRLGKINTVGRTGLWITLVPAVIGIAALLLVSIRIRLGGRLLSIYALFWTAVLGAGLPVVWNAQTSFCTRTFCIRTPWIGRTLLLALAGAFVSVAIWSWREARGKIAQQAIRSSPQAVR